MKIIRFEKYPKQSDIPVRDEIEVDNNLKPESIYNIIQDLIAPVYWAYRILN